MTQETERRQTWHRGKGYGSTWPDCICEGTEIIARVNGTGYPIGTGWSETSEARANLMAAAPDMLAACRDALEVECDMAESPDSELARRLRAAIALATGEEPEA